jgi:archaellum biogenesis protein FlaJ (TadC family)
MRLYFKKINDLLKKWAKELNTAFSKEEILVAKKST